MKERMYWLGFSNFPGIGAGRLQMLLKKFWTAENAWNATESELKHSGIGLKLTDQFLDFRKQFSPIAYAEKLAKQHVSFMTLGETDYPNLLKQIQNPPFILYLKGNRELLNDDPLVAIVGTRKITDYGKQVTQTLTQELSSAGCVIVSGLAMGVDSVAHAATLDAHGKTIAVLGSGVDYCTPRENQHLYERILDQDGLIVSEYPLGQMPNKGSFPARNRIIAGMSLGVLVPEGAQDSGSLITAHLALQEKRMVFAVPGPITSSVSKGPIALINDGAKMVVSAKDILEALHIKSTTGSASPTRITGETEEEQMIIAILENESLQFDEIVKRTGMGSSQVGTLLSIMEMKGFVTSLDAGMFGIAS